MLLFLHQHLCSIMMGQCSLDQRHIVGTLGSETQYLGITGSFCGLIYFLSVSFLSDMSCSFFTSPVNFLLYIDISPRCLLITRVTDSTAGTPKCGEVGFLPRAQKEWKDRLFFFFLRKNKPHNLKHVSLPG